MILEDESIAKTFVVLQVQDTIAVSPEHIFERTKGQKPLPSMRTLSRTKSDGRLARSVDIMTQRPVMGSLRNSGNPSSWDAAALKARSNPPYYLIAPERYTLARSRQRVRAGMGACDPLVSKSPFVQTIDRAIACAGLDSQYVIAPVHPAVAQKLPCHSYEKAPFIVSDR